MPEIETPKPHRRKPAAEQRISQLLSKNHRLQEQVAYMQWVVSRMIPLLPKATVSNILDAGKSFHNQQLKEKLRVSSQAQHRHQPQPSAIA